MSLTALHNKLTVLSQISSARFDDGATQRQIGFIIAIVRTNGISATEIIEAIEFYNGGEAFGFDKECASAIIGTYATPHNMRERAIKARG